MDTPLSRQVYYTGRVQGVGFRWFVKQVASGYEVTGWVRNLDDGRVELQVTGTAGEVFAFLEAVRGGRLATHIRQVEEIDVESSTERVKGFKIKE